MANQKNMNLCIKTKQLFRNDINFLNQFKKVIKNIKQ